MCSATRENLSSSAFCPQLLPLKVCQFAAGLSARVPADSFIHRFFSSEHPSAPWRLVTSYHRKNKS